MSNLRIGTFGDKAPPWVREAMRAAIAPTGEPLAWAGGKGSGKSAGIGAIMCLLAYTRPGAELALCMDTYGSLRDIHLPIVSRFARQLGGVWRATDAEFRFDTGSVLRMRHLDTPGDPRVGGSPIEGGNYHIIGADECQQTDARYWSVFNERARVNATDLAGNICPPRVITSGLPRLTWWCAETLRAGGRVWRPRTRDNPNLPADYEARIRAAYTEREARAMVDGEEWAPEGQIVEEYRAALEPDGCLTDWRPASWGSARTVLGMDLGGNNPHAILAAEDAERGRWAVMREWYSTGRHITIGEFCRRIGADVVRRAQWGGDKDPRIPLDEIVADPAGAARSSQTGIADLDLIALQYPDGLGLRPVIETIPERRSVVGSLSRLRLAIERGRIVFSRELMDKGAKDDSERSLHRSLMGYVWDPRGREEPLKDDVHDHAVDALRYLARRILWHVVEPVHESMPGHSEPRPPPAALRHARAGR